MYSPFPARKTEIHRKEGLPSFDTLRRIADNSSSAMAHNTALRRHRDVLSLAAATEDEASQLASPVFSDDEDDVDELMEDELSSDSASDRAPSTSSPARPHPGSKSSGSRITGLNYPPLHSAASLHPSLGSSTNNLRLPPLMTDANSRPQKSNKLPPIYKQFMREFSAAPINSPDLPTSNPPSVPKETCQELRQQNINPFWVVLPRFGDPCPFSDKASCLRSDWRPAMWERHVQTHLPDSMKEFWECPHCFRPFNRKCAFVNHLRKTRTECGVRGTLEKVDESQWKGKWFHEPMPLRRLRPQEGGGAQVQRRKWQNRTSDV